MQKVFINLFLCRHEKKTWKNSEKWQRRVSRLLFLSRVPAFILAPLRLAPNQGRVSSRTKALSFDHRLLWPGIVSVPLAALSGRCLRTFKWVGGLSSELKAP